MRLRSRAGFGSGRIALRGGHVVASAIALAVAPTALSQLVAEPFVSPEVRRFAEFGTTLAIDGDTLVISAPGVRVMDQDHYVDRGELHMYRHIDGQWVLEATFAPNLNQEPIGTTMALHEGIVVSRLQVFERTFAGWVNTGGLQFAGGMAPSTPKSLSISGRRIAFGSEFAEGRGAVYVFEPNSSGDWAEVAELTVPDDWVGVTVALEGERILTSGNGGGIKVFELSDTGDWTHVATFNTEPPLQPFDEVTQLALWGDVAMVRTSDPLGTGVALAGGVVVFERIDGEWVQQQVLTPPYSGANWFGRTMSLQGNRAVIGDIAAPGSGAAYVYERSGGVWSLMDTIVAPGVGPGDQYAKYVALDGDRIVVGAPLMDGPTTNDEGKAWVIEDAAAIDPASANVQSSGQSYATLADAVDAAPSGDTIDATPQAYMTASGIDFDGKALTLTTDASVRQSVGASWSNLGDTTITVDPTHVVDIAGAIGLQAGATLTINADRFFLDSSAQFNAGPDTTLILENSFEIAGERGNIDLRDLQIRFVGDHTRSLEATVRDGGGEDPPAFSGQTMTLKSLRVEAGVLKIVNRRANHTFDVRDVVYVDDLIVDAGARLETRGIRVYARTINIEGEVDDPSNVARINHPCFAADLNADGVVDGADLGLLLNLWGPTPYYDIVGDDFMITGADLGVLLSAWGPCP